MLVEVYYLEEISSGAVLWQTLCGAGLWGWRAILYILMNSLHMERGIGNVMYT